jgi:drug/metabolite transporter (DMT)-like permease
MMICFCLFSVSQLLTRKIMRSEIPAIQVTSSQMISASVVLILYLIIFGDMELPLQASSGTLMTFVYLVFSMALPFFFYNQAMRHIPVGMASLFLVLIIPLGFLFAAILLGEDITWIKIAGAILVMIGVALPHLLESGERKLSLRQK